MNLLLVEQSNLWPRKTRVEAPHASASELTRRIFTSPTLCSSCPCTVYYGLRVISI